MHSLACCKLHAPKCRLTFGVIFQKTGLFLTAVFIIKYVLQIVICLCWYFTWLTFRPWRWQGYVLPKCWAVSELHGVTTQKTAFFIITTVRTSNPTCLLWLLIIINMIFFCVLVRAHELVYYFSFSSEYLRP
jgi:hypothetical protein